LIRGKITKRKAQGTRYKVQETRKEVGKAFDQRQIGEMLLIFRDV